jgi:hypothetical protein
LIATSAFRVEMSTVSSALGTVENGFIAARRRMGWPVLMPPSIPPARALLRESEPALTTISSCAFDPGRAAEAKPSPTSTPFTDWMLMRASVSWASSLRSWWT